MLREVRPTKLSLALVVLQVSGTAVAAKDACKDLAQQLYQHLGPARQGNLIEDKGGSHQRPEPALFPPGSIARFVAVDHRLMASCFASSAQGSETASLASSQEF